MTLKRTENEVHCRTREMKLYEKGKSSVTYKKQNRKFRLHVKSKNTGCRIESEKDLSGSRNNPLPPKLHHKTQN